MRFCLFVSLWLNAGLVLAAQPQTESGFTLMPDQLELGPALQARPRWQGSAQHRKQVEPYFYMQWADRVELSSDEGLKIDALHDVHWHGGPIGTLTWGRSARDLGELASKLHTLGNTYQGGAYVEYAWREGLAVGLKLSHDLAETGAAYGEVYGDLGLPSPEAVEHGFRLVVAGMNRSAMQRFYGVSASEASALGVGSYEGSAGVSRMALIYGLEVKLGDRWGLTGNIEWARLLGSAANSPLVRDFGSRNQRSYTIAAYYRFK